MRKPILCLDFDGVLHSYASGWKGADIIPDPPVAGAAQFIATAQEHFTVAVHSSRSCQPGGIEAMRKYLHKAIIDADLDGSIFDAIEWPTEKPPAQITIDDRAVTFTGSWPSMQSLKGVSSMEQAHRVKWVDAGREPQSPPNPNYPDGVDVIETTGADTCKIALPYPAKRCGRYEVKCRACGRLVVVTTAGRPDDPRSLTMQCAGRKQTTN